MSPLSGMSPQHEDISGKGDVHAFCHDPAGCPCECRVCKRAWYDAGRPPIASPDSELRKAREALTKAEEEIQRLKRCCDSYESDLRDRAGVMAAVVVATAPRLFNFKVTVKCLRCTRFLPGETAFEKVALDDLAKVLMPLRSACGCLGSKPQLYVFNLIEKAE